VAFWLQRVSVEISAFRSRYDGAHCACRPVGCSTNDTGAITAACCDAGRRTHWRRTASCWSACRNDAPGRVATRFDPCRRASCGCTAGGCASRCCGTINCRPASTRRRASRSCTVCQRATPTRRTTRRGADWGRLYDRQSPARAGHDLQYHRQDSGRQPNWCQRLQWPMVPSLMAGAGRLRDCDEPLSECAPAGLPTAPAWLRAAARLRRAPGLLRSRTLLLRLRLLRTRALLAPLLAPALVGGPVAFIHRTCC
jgi:hypothetical protein